LPGGRPLKRSISHSCPVTTSYVTAPKCVDRVAGVVGAGCTFCESCGSHLASRIAKGQAVYSCHGSFRSSSPKPALVVLDKSMLLHKDRTASIIQSGPLLLFRVHFRINLLRRCKLVKACSTQFKLLHPPYCFRVTLVFSVNP
jgi:hypothetical protein